MDISVRRQALEDMRQEIQSRIDQAEEDLEAIDRLLAVQGELEPEIEFSSVDEIRRAAIRVLIGRGEDGLHRQAILERLEETGVNIRGKKPVHTLGSILSRFSKDFEPCGKGIWRTYWPAPAQGGMAAMVDDALENNVPLAKLLIDLEERRKLIAGDEEALARLPHPAT